MAIEGGKQHRVMTLPLKPTMEVQCAVWLVQVPRAMGNHMDLGFLSWTLIHRC